MFEHMEIEDICKLNEKMALIYTNGKNNYLNYVQEKMNLCQMKPEILFIMMKEMNMKYMKTQKKHVI